MENIEANCVIGVRGVKIRNIFNPSLRNEIKKLSCEITMRVKDAYAAAGINVLDDKVFKKCRFARSRFSNDVGVVSAVCVKEPERGILPPTMTESKNDIEVLIHIRNRASTPRKKISSEFLTPASKKLKNAIGDMRLFPSRQGNRGSTGNRKEDGQRIRLYQESPATGGGNFR